MIRKIFLSVLACLTLIPVFSQVNYSKINVIKKALLDQTDLVSSEVKDITITDDYFDEGSGINYVYVRQSFHKLPVFNALATVALKDGKVVHVAHRFIDHLDRRPHNDQFIINGEMAFNFALVDPTLNEKTLTVPAGKKRDDLIRITDEELSEYPIEIEKGYLYINEELRPSWFIRYVTLDQNHTWYIHVDATNAQILSKHDLVISCNFGEHKNCNHADIQTQPSVTQITTSQKTQADASYEVFAVPVESPNHGNRSVVEDPADSIASPFGWHDTNGVIGAEFNTTRGNNVRARDDIDANNSGGTSPNGGAALSFSAPFDIAMSADNYLDAAIINLFYWNNLMHDVWYHYGFDEASGNFQENNYGKGGQGSDFVNADAQDGSGTNNANFNPLQEGRNPRMQMFLWAQGVTGDLFEVTIPNAIKGKYGAVQSGFGPRLTLSPLTSQLALVDGGGSDGSSGCNSLTNGAEVSGKIAVIDRGGCTFVQKVTNAQDAGAIGVIMINNVGGNPIVMGGTGAGISIPQIMITRANGTTIKNRMGTESVTGKLYDSTNAGVFFFDSDFDNGIIVHEYTHGISVRLTGGPANSGCLANTEQMGEGWSDFLSLVMTHEPGDQGSDKRGIGTYVRNQSTTGGGIRPFPYSTNMAINPVTYDYIKLNNFTRPHGVGSAWCTMLWDLYWAFIDEYGYDSDLYYGTGGNNMVMHLVMDGLKLQPCGPGFVDGRDAILKADELRYGSANDKLIWNVFARRGLGFSADQASTNSKTDGTQAFDLPPNFGRYTVEKIGELTAESGDTITYTFKVKNTGSVSLDEIIVKDSLGIEGSYLADQSSCVLGLTPGNSTFEWKVVNLAAGDSVVCSYTVVIDPDKGGHLIWFDDVETDTMGWTAVSDLGGGLWLRSTNESTSGTTSWFINNAPNQTDRWIENSFDLSKDTSPYLTFKHLFDTEDGWDGAVVEALDNGTWVDLGNNMVQGGYNSVIENNPASRIQNRNAFTGKTDGFISTTIDLTEFAGDTIDIRFRFVSDGLQGGRGWFIDDIQLWDSYTSLTNTLTVSSTDLTGKSATTYTEIIWKKIVKDTTVDPTDTIIINPPYFPGVFVFPNPVKDNVTVLFRPELPVVKRDIDLSLFDALGRRLWEDITNEEGRVIIPMSHLASGMYILEIIDGDDVHFFKLIRE